MPPETPGACHKSEQEKTRQNQPIPLMPDLRTAESIRHIQQGTRNTNYECES